MASTRDALRRQRRRELDARRSKSRVRLGSCQQSWGQLKDSLGFSLHSELAHYLLDSYFSKECAKCAGSAKDDTGAVVTSSIESLHRLVLLVHSHGQQCPFPPTLQAGSAWENLASGTEGRPSRRERVKRRRGTKRLAPQAGVKDSASSEEEISPCSQGKEKEKGEAAHVLESELCLCYVCEGSHLLSWTPMLSSSEEERGGSSGEGEGGGGKRGDTVAGSDKSRGRGRRRAQEPKKECVRKSARRAARPRTRAGARSVVTQEDEEPEEELMDLTTSNPGESNSIGNDPTQMESETGSDTMPEESLQSLEDWQPLDNNREDDSTPDSDNDNHHIEIVTGENDVPSPHRGKQSADVSQIAGKKKRKAAAPKEFLPCEFEGCGKIFSSRWFLNHHMKYQHVHQRTFTCSHSNCGKSFNYKKHLKEHEKLHSNQRDFICEFCARAFRTSSHLLVHCRIHTGEKPLQCEVCGFTCRQKASLNWHMRKHNTESSYQFPCEVCGRRFEKRDNLISHRRRSHSAQASGPAAVADSPPSGHTHPPPTGTGPAPPTDRGLDTHTDPPQPSRDPTHTDPPQPSSDPTHTDPPQPSSDPTHTDPPQPSSDPTHTDPPQPSSDPTLTDGDTGDSTVLQT